SKGGTITDFLWKAAFGDYDQSPYDTSQLKVLANSFKVIANKEGLTGLKFCLCCQVKRFDIKCSNNSRDYERHVVKCEQRGGKLVKIIILDQVQKPYCPHIVQKNTFAYLLAHGREQEFKPMQYYITYDLETVEKKQLYKIMVVEGV
ncbi:MAG: hypothetical protein EZS28_042350, partial [Streblomastix strix]